MAKDPAFLFYPGDWSLGTMHMTILEKGAYIELLMLQFAREKFTEAHAKHMLNGSFGLVWDNIKEKFETDGKFFWNARLMEEKEKRKTFTESRRTNALHIKNENKSAKAYAKHMHEHMEDENEDINKDVFNINIPFEYFWNAYEKKVGDQVKIKKKWETLKDGDRLLIIAHLPKYKLSQPDKKFRKNPQTYLNNKSWNDEIIENNGNTKKSITGNNRNAGTDQVLERLNAKLAARGKGSTEG